MYMVYLIHYTQNERIIKGKQMTTMEHVIIADACVCNAISGDLAIYTRNGEIHIGTTVLCINTNYI